jgi:hypothetical protein
MADTAGVPGKQNELSLSPKLNLSSIASFRFAKGFTYFKESPQ